MVRSLFNANGTAKADLFRVALSTLTNEQVFQLISVKLNHNIDDKGNKLESIRDITYTVFVPDFMCQLDIKVDSTVPVIAPEKLKAEMETGNEVFVELPTSETHIKPYKMEYGAYKVSIHAPYIKLVQE